MSQTRKKKSRPHPGNSSLYGPIPVNPHLHHAASSLVTAIMWQHPGPVSIFTLQTKIRSSVRAARPYVRFLPNDLHPVQLPAEPC